MIQLNGGKFKSEDKYVNRLEQDGIVNGSSQDLWDDTDNNEKKKIPDFMKSTAEVTKASVVPKTLKVNPIKITSNELTDKKIHAGKSYNPSLESWKELINQEYDIEYKRELTRQQIEEHRNKIKELMITLDDNMLSDSDDDEDDEDNDKVEEEEQLNANGEKDYSLSINKPNKIKIKTKTKKKQRVEA